MFFVYSVPQCDGRASVQTAQCKYKMVMTIAGARAGLDGDSVQIRYYTASA